MHKELLILCLVFTTAVLPEWAGAETEVTNVQAAQRGDGSGLVDITYDLASAVGSTTLSYVSVQISPDGGATWPFWASSNHLTGDVGKDIQNGTGRQIVWNAAADRPDVAWPNCRVRVRASDFEDELTILLPGGVPLVLVRIPAGTFLMGSNPDERNRTSLRG